MIALFNLKDRKPIWMALSKFYLDTELQDSDFRHIAFIILESPYTFDEVKKINKYEVFPVLQPNLLSTAGEWAGFDEDWLVDKIQTLINKKSTISNVFTEVAYVMFNWMCKDYWKKLEAAYNDIKNNTDSYIVTCRDAFLKNVFPFQFEQKANTTYQELKQIALEYKEKEQLNLFCQYLQEGQYYINFWTAYFLLEIFELKGTEKLIGLNDSNLIVPFCYDIIERHFQNFKDKSQI